MNLKSASFLSKSRHITQKSIRYAKFIQAYLYFNKLSLHSKGHFIMKWKDRYPCLMDNTAETIFDRHYVYHTAWAARLLQRTKPLKHVDLSSCLRFVGIASAFVPIRHYDYRPPAIALPDLTTAHADLLNLPFDDKSISSLSCMHVIEHVGLGRYGDPLDPQTAI